MSLKVQVVVLVVFLSYLTISELKNVNPSANQGTKKAAQPQGTPSPGGPAKTQANPSKKAPNVKQTGKVPLEKVGAGAGVEPQSKTKVKPEAAAKLTKEQVKELHQRKKSAPVKGQHHEEPKHAEHSKPEAGKPKHGKGMHHQAHDLHHNQHHQGKQHVKPEMGGNKEVPQKTSQPAQDPDYNEVTPEIVTEPPAEKVEEVVVSKQVDESSEVSPGQLPEKNESTVTGADDLMDGQYNLTRYNRSSEECKKGCSPSGVPYLLIRDRPPLRVVKPRTPVKAGASHGAQKPFHSPSGVSYESIRNRPEVDFKLNRAKKESESGSRIQKPFHTVSGIPYADIRNRTPLPDWYYTKSYRSGERKGGDFAPTDQGGLRPIDESLYTDPVLLGQPEDFFEGGRLRNRDYLRKTLHLNSKKQRLPKSLINTITLRLKEIYHKSIRPLETLYKYEEMALGTISEAVISAKPMVLFLGPWSTGKSTMINWFVGLPRANQLYSGTQPTTSEFTVIMAGDHPRTVEGIVLAADSKQPFAGLEQFGTQFLEKFQGLEYPSQLLERVTLVDTPGIIENRHKQERGYPFNDVMQWFIDRAHLIVLVFDPTKLDVGSELETLFTRLKGRESQLRLLLNKADSIPMQELMRVYGTLFWNLAPFMNVTEPPRVYTGSCWWKDMQAKGINAELFLSEEKNLLNDINDVIENQLHNKIAMLRQHAIKVRTHALLVDRFLYMWNKNQNNDKFNVQEMIEKPEKYHIYKFVQHHANVSKYDMPEPSKYKQLFDEHPLTTFRSLESLCSLFAGCPIEILESAIQSELPTLLNSLDVSIKEHQAPDAKEKNETAVGSEKNKSGDSNSTKVPEQGVKN